MYVCMYFCPSCALAYCMHRKHMFVHMTHYCNKVWCFFTEKYLLCLCTTTFTSEGEVVNCKCLVVQVVPFIPANSFQQQIWFLFSM